MALLKAIEQVLKSADEPLHVAVIVEKVICGGLWKSSGKTSQATIGATLYSDTRGPRTGAAFHDSGIRAVWHFACWEALSDIGLGVGFRRGIRKCRPVEWLSRVVVNVAYRRGQHRASTAVGRVRPISGRLLADCLRIMGHAVSLSHS